MGEPIILSHYQVEPLLSARFSGQTSIVTSLDLGLSTNEVQLDAERVVLSGREWLSWESITEIAQNESVCFVVEANRTRKIHSFSEFLNRFYSLMPTEAAPTLLISGIPMHRIQGITPDRDTLSKIRSIAPVTGRVLDTCTGLGYTAIEAARTAEELITIELDPTVLEVARLNPWSRPLFENPRIQQIVGDAFEEIQGMEDASFTRILHDPPMFSLAGELYSGEYYRHLFRVLKRKGRLFHYVGDPGSRSGRGVARGVVRRLQEAGFARVVRKPGAFGVVAYKG
jgi:predicted methyltransferase